MVNVKLSTFLMTMSTFGVMYTTASPVNHKLARRGVTHDGDDLGLNVMKRQWYSPWYRPPPPSFPYNPWNGWNGENQGSTTLAQSMTSASTTATKPKPSITNFKPTSSVGLLPNLHPFSTAQSPAPTTTKANPIASGKVTLPNVTHRPESQPHTTQAVPTTQSVQPGQSQSTNTKDSKGFDSYNPARPWQPYTYQYHAPPPTWYGRPWYAHRRDEGVYGAYHGGYYGHEDDEGLQARWY